MIKYFAFFCFTTSIVFLSSCNREDEPPIYNEPFYYHITSSEDIDKFFAYNSDHYNIIASGHKGGVIPGYGYPENCLETMDRMLYTMPLFFEVDPRLTKDSVIILMHDDTLGRSIEGRGRVSELMFDEIKVLKLKDSERRLTTYNISELNRVLEWSKDKAILNFDRKDVPQKMLCEIVKSHGGKNCIFTVHGVDAANEILSYIPDARFSAFMGTLKQFEDYQKAGLLPHVVIAYVEDESINDKELVSVIHNAGIRCMVATNANGWENEMARIDFFSTVISTKPDIIETDYPLSLRFFPEVRSNVE